MIEQIWCYIMAIIFLISLSVYIFEKDSNVYMIDQVWNYIIAIIVLILLIAYAVYGLYWASVDVAHTGNTGFIGNGDTNITGNISGDPVIIS